MSESFDDVQWQWERLIEIVTFMEDLMMALKSRFVLAPTSAKWKAQIALLPLANELQDYLEDVNYTVGQLNTLIKYTTQTEYFSHPTSTPRVELRLDRIVGICDDLILEIMSAVQQCGVMLGVMKNAYDRSSIPQNIYYESQRALLEFEQIFEDATLNAEPMQSELADIMHELEPMAHMAPNPLGNNNNTASPRSLARG